MSQKTSIFVDKETNKKFQQVKLDIGAKSATEVLEYLIELHLKHGVKR